MGLFSFLGKNKQDRTPQDSGRFSSGDEFAERARAKRASHAGEGARRGARGGDDPVLPEKKRARRRLVGAIALALAAAVGLPMLLDSEPKPLAGDIAIQIPSKDKAAPLPVPSEPEAASQPVAAADSVDKGEEVVAPPKPTRADPQAVAEVRTAPARPPVPEPVAQQPKEAAHAPRAEAARASDLPMPEHEHKAKVAETKQPEKSLAKKAEDKPAHVQPVDSARALAILEGKQADKAVDAGEKVTFQVAALGSQEKAAELQARLRAAGIHSFTEKVAHPGGDLIRVKVGPYSKDEAEKVRAKLAHIK
jgi:DedD protein